MSLTVTSPILPGLTNFITPTGGQTSQSSTGISAGGSNSLATTQNYLNPLAYNTPQAPLQMIDPASGNYVASGGGAGGAANGAGSASDVATYTDNISALNALLGQADINRQQGQTGINESFDRSNAQLADQQTGVMNKFDNQQTDTTRGYQTNLNTIDNQARSGFQSLQALLGGSGSAGEILAPMAVANVAGGQTNNARDSFAKNLQSLATARTDAGKQFKQAQDDLLGQKNSKLQALITSIDQQKQNYLGQIGQQQNLLNIAKGGSYATPTAQNAAIAQLQAEQNGLMDQYKAPAFTPQNVNVQAPDLTPYVAQAATIGGTSNQQAGQGAVDPSIALQALLLKQQQQQYNPYGA